MENQIVCSKCKCLVSKFRIKTHEEKCTGDPKKFRGLTANKVHYITDFTGNCKFCNKECKNLNAQNNHERMCKENPNRNIRKYPPKKPKPVLPRKSREEISDNLSESMKKAHKEGRAWNIGKSRWNNKPSYPEEFFMRVIENDFEDKNYVRELPFGRFSLDFAWVDKKICIEIDGEHHQRFEECILRDKEKDALLIQKGWKVLRVPWKSICNDTRSWIEICKSFVNNESISEERQFLINKFIEAQLTKQRLIVEKRENKEREKQKLIEYRQECLEKVDLMKFGWVTKISKLWGISSQKVHCYMRKYFNEIPRYKRKSYK